MPIRRAARSFARLLGWTEITRSSGVGRTLAAVAVIDATGTGVFMATIAVFLVGVRGLSIRDVGLGFSIAGIAGFLATVPMASLAARLGARRFLIATSAAKTAAFALYLAVGSFAAFAVVAAVVATTSAAWFPAQQGLIGALLEERARVEVLASIRALRNVGYAVGGLLAVPALAIGGHGAFVAIVLANAASYALMTRLYWSLPHVTAEVEADRPRLRPWRDLRYAALTVTSTVFALSIVLLDIGIPLWIVRRTTAPHLLVGVVLVINTLLVVLFQVRGARGSETVAGSLALLRRSAVAFALFCACFAFAGRVGAVAAGALIVLGAVVLTVGEMLESPAWWTISFELAPAESRTEYLGVFSLNYEIVAILGPALMAVLVEAGTGGWIVLALAFVAAAGLATWLVPASRLAVDEEVASGRAA